MSYFGLWHIWVHINRSSALDMFYHSSTAYLVHWYIDCKCQTHGIEQNKDQESEHSITCPQGSISIEECPISILQLQGNI